MKNILKKANTFDSTPTSGVGGDQERFLKTKKKVSFNLKIGTGTRGQGHPDEVADNYLNDDESNAKDDSFFTKSPRNLDMTPKEVEQMKMALPGQNTR